VANLTIFGDLKMARKKGGGRKYKIGLKKSKKKYNNIIWRVENG
jgi:hypothetical protein